jgi:hypothetical protein
MTTTARAPGRLGFDPDYYLDCRRPEWQLYEVRGLVRCEHGLGSSAPLVFVNEHCVEVLAILRAQADRGTRATR